MDLKASYFLPLWRGVSFGKQVSLECFSFNQGGWKKKSWLSHMIEFLDPDSSAHLGSALWSEICTERRLCVILKAILCPWKSRWVFIFISFWVFCFKRLTHCKCYIFKVIPWEKISHWGGVHDSQLPTSSYLGHTEFTSLLLLLEPRAKTPHPWSISCWSLGIQGWVGNFLPFGRDCERADLEENRPQGSLRLFFLFPMTRN